MMGWRPGATPSPCAMTGAHPRPRTGSPCHCGSTRNRRARLAPARPGWARAPADQLNGAFVEAHHRARRIGRRGVEIEHVLHTGDVRAIDLRHAPHLLAPGFEL